MRIALLFLVLLLGACSTVPITAQRQAKAQAVVEAQQARTVECRQADGCGLASPLRQLAASTGKHQVILLDQGHDALLTRLHMIESARESIELQVFIYDLDETGTLVLDALVRAAQRGVKVRLLLDQLYGLTRPKLQAKLAVLHANFELRLYSPMFNQAKTSKAEFFAGILFRFRNLNQRMHTKLLLVDDRMAIVGGRNIQDRYFDWGQSYNYRDRDVWISGPVALKMRDNFNAFWHSERSFRAVQLEDVNAELLAAQQVPNALALQPRPYSERMLQMAEMAQQGERVLAVLKPLHAVVAGAAFYADLPEKHVAEASSRARASNAVYQIISEAQHSVLLQTPYLVMSRMARQTFRQLQRRDKPVSVWVSTNSLAATDAFPVYALSHKYKRLYLYELGFRIHEFKPFPASAYMRVGQSVGWPDKLETNVSDGPRLLGYSGSGPKMIEPADKSGQRVGLHAKSMVIDDAIAVIGSHNFDPRSDDFNTESMLLIEDRAFAAQLTASIRNDMQPENAWAIAPREIKPALARINYRLGKISEKLPIFDIWPWPYATSYQVQPGCGILDYSDARFAQCSQAVGDFPEVDGGAKGLYTRIITAFGAGLEPIL
jgi:cardiolipin synthase C